MTDLTAFLDRFDAIAPDRPAKAQAPGTDEMEATRAAAYEAGYKSGWDDCAAADETARNHVSAELTRTLRDLGFTYHEARAHMLSELEPLLHELFGTVLPAVTLKGTIALLVEDVLKDADVLVNGPVEIVVAPSECETVKGLLPERTSLPLELVEEPALAAGQVFLRFGTRETAFDLSRLSGRLLDALGQMQRHSRRETSHA